MLDPERSRLKDHVHRKLTDTASNVAIVFDLTGQIHVLIQDGLTGKRYGCFALIEDEGDKIKRVTRTSIGELDPSAKVAEIADMLIEHALGTPLVCDEAIAKELEKESLTWIKDGHYRLEGRPGGGTLEVYTPLESKRLSPDQLSPGVAGAQIITERQ